MAKDLEPQLTDADLELIRDTRADFHATRAIPVTVKTMVVTGVDPHTDEPIGTVTETTLSGVVQRLSDEDRLLRLGGRIRVGDLKLTLLYEDAVSVSLEALREARIALAGSPEHYIVDVLDVQGLGLRNRVELGLVLL